MGNFLLCPVYPHPPSHGPTFTIKKRSASAVHYSHHNIENTTVVPFRDLVYLSDHIPLHGKSFALVPSFETPSDVVNFTGSVGRLPLFPPSLSLPSKGVLVAANDHGLRFSSPEEYSTSSCLGRMAVTGVPLQLAELRVLMMPQVVSDLAAALAAILTLVLCAVVTISASALPPTTMLAMVMLLLATVARTPASTVVNPGMSPLVVSLTHADLPPTVTISPIAPTPESSPASAASARRRVT